MSPQGSISGLPRRDFLKQTAAVGLTLCAANLSTLAAADGKKVPWFRRVTRWGQTNITEIDPTRYDVGWWRKHWKRTGTEGVIINAGGIVAYYPSRVPLHRPAQYLEGRDLFGELCRAAHQDGLAVFARMDSNRAHEEFYRANPNWFAVDANGKPYKAGEMFISCINGPYYEEHIPAILRELIGLYHPEGFTDNSWSGLGRSSICYCENCRKKFNDRTGKNLPKEKNWNDPVYRQWIQWSYARRLEIWDLNNRVTKAAGGPECIWSGMNSGSISGQCQSFRDLREICRRAEILMLDHQARGDASGFQNNGETGKLVHGLLGWDKLAPESMALYQAGKPAFRLASKPEPEARLWMLEGLAGGIQPWWHHVGAYHEDRRMYHTAETVYRWHKENEEFLVNRRPIATVGVLWSQRNTDFYGRDDADLLVDMPWRGMTQALIRARIPYLPVHADDLDREAEQLSLLILPNLGAMSKAQLESVRRFVQRGGSLLATGESTLYDEWGDPLPDFALADLFGAHLVRRRAGTDSLRAARDTAHTYLRLLPELRRQVDGPETGNEPMITGKRHEVLRGFEETDILPFGGALETLKLASGAQIIATFVPSFPIYPPETAWMRQSTTEIPGIILNTTAQGNRIAYLPADLDRRFARDNLPDHGNLLKNIIRWAAKDNLPLSVDGPGVIDCHLYQQGNRLILHLVNLTNPATWRQPVDELIPVGPVRVKVKLPRGISGKSLRLLVSGQKASATINKGWSQFDLKSIVDHEVVVLS